MNSLSPLLTQAKHQWPRLFEYIARIRAFLEPDVLTPGYAKLIIKRGHKSKYRVRVTKEY